MVFPGLSFQSLFLHTSESLFLGLSSEVTATAGAARQIKDIYISSSVIFNWAFSVFISCFLGLPIVQQLWVQEKKVLYFILEVASDRMGPSELE